MNFSVVFVFVVVVVLVHYSHIFLGNKSLAREKRNDTQFMTYFYCSITRVIINCNATLSVDIFKIRRNFKINLLAGN